MKREWKHIKGFENRYLISSDGLVKSIIRKKHIIIKAHKNDHGYLHVSLRTKDGLSKCKKIHRLVAENFILNIKNKFTVNHIDGNKLNNTVSNLEWATQTENNVHSFYMGLSKVGEDHTNSKFTKKEIVKTFNTTQSMISRIVNYKIWKHVD